MATRNERRILAQVDQLEMGGRADSPTAFTAGEQVVVRPPERSVPYTNIGEIPTFTLSTDALTTVRGTGRLYPWLARFSPQVSRFHVC